jgi:hypothetical protein
VSAGIADRRRHFCRAQIGPHIVHPQKFHALPDSEGGRGQGAFETFFDGQ